MSALAVRRGATSTPCVSEPGVSMNRPTRFAQGEPMLGKLLIRYLRTYRLLLLGVLVFQFASAMASLYLPRLNADIIDNGVARGDTAYIWSRGAIMLLIALGQIVAAVIATLCAARAAMAAGRDIRRDVFQKVSGFSEREVSRFGPGTLITRNTNDVQQVQMLAMMGATMLVTAPMLAIGGIIMALQQDVGLSWLIGVSVPLLLVIAGVIISRMVPLFRQFQTRLDNVNRIMREQLTGVRVVRAFVRERIEEERFRGANTDIMIVGRKVGSLFVLMFPLAMLVLNVTVVGVIWFGGIQVDQGNVQIGTLFAFMQYVGQILMGVLMATFMTIMIPRAAVSADRIGEVLASHDALERPAEPVTTFTDPGAIVFDDVSFTYPAPTPPCSRASRSGRRRARRSPSSARPGRARRRSSLSSRGCSTSPAARCASRASTSGEPTSTSCGRASATSRSGRSCSRGRSRPTSASAARTRPTTSCGALSRSLRPGTSSPRWKAGSTRGSPRAARTCRAVSGSGSRSHERSSGAPTSSCSTTRSRRSTSPPTHACARRSGANCPT
nr:hypothetical protein GCM10017544_00070 [Microbacterium imperiale]